MGYHRAGFDIVGVDINPQPHYPFEFHRMDWAEALEGYPHLDFDVIHASPPCQAFSPLQNMWNSRDDHPDLIAPTRDRLKATGLPYVIENVPGAPLLDHVTLCGSAFLLGCDGAELRRHRNFEINPHPVLVPPCYHFWAAETVTVAGHTGNKLSVARRVIGVYGGHGRDQRRRANTQDFSTADRKTAMGIDWMNGDELCQAIPPAYTEWIGQQLMAAL